MSLNAFLASLPALLAVAAFVVYRLLSHQSEARDITKAIVAKLRKDSPESANSIAGLAPRQVVTKLRLETDLRAKVSEQDFHLLTRVSQQEFIKALVVYTLIAIAFTIGVAAFTYVQTRTRAVQLSDWHIESAAEEAKGLAVDTDHLVVTWHADGPPEDIHLAVENVQSGRRSPDLVVSSAEQRITIEKGSYSDILLTRERGKTNRIRVVARTSGGAEASAETPLYVGINITAIPVKEDSALWLVAMIDNSSIPNYNYQAKVVVWPRHGEAPISFGDDMKNPKTVYAVRDFSDVDFTTLKIAYFGPDDNRVVRTGLIGQ